MSLIYTRKNKIIKIKPQSIRPFTIVVSRILNESNIQTNDLGKTRIKSAD